MMNIEKQEEALAYVMKTAELMVEDLVYETRCHYGFSSTEYESVQDAHRQIMEARNLLPSHGVG